MATRTINISLTEQSPRKRTLVFTPRIASADGDVVLATQYKKTTNASGDATIALPTRASGTITYDYKIPTEHGYSYGYFHLSAGSAIDLDDLIAAGGTPSDTVIDYVDARFDGLTGLDLTSPTDGQKLVIRDDAIINVSETYRRLDTEYGVTPDVAADQSAAIQLALNDLRDAGGGTIVFPNGITKMKAATVTDFDNNRGAIRILGDGGKSIIRIGNGHADQATGISALYLEGPATAVVEGLTFLGTGVAGQLDFARSVIFFAGTERAVVRDCHFINLAMTAPLDATFALNKGYGIVVGYRSNLVVEGCLFEGCETFNAPHIESYEWRSLFVRDTELLDIGRLGGTDYNKSQDGNSFWIRAILPLPLATSGWHRNKVKLEGVTFDENYRAGVFVDDAEWVEINNLGANAGLGAGTGEAIYLKNVENVTIKDVLAIKANYATTQTARFEACNSVNIDGYTHANGALTIETTSATKRLKMRNAVGVSVVNTANSFLDLDQAMPTTASAAALAPKGKTTHVTGTTNITSIDTTNLKPGDTFTLIFDGILTVTHGNNIKLDGGANFTTAAHSMLKLEYDGTNCYEISRKA